jgi:hypothetical protein
VKQPSPAEARILALAAQSGVRRPDKVTASEWRKTFDWLSLHPIDSVNIWSALTPAPPSRASGPMTGA